MRILLKIFAVAILLIAQSAYAKEIAVLLPVTGPLTPFEKMELSKEVVGGFSAKFDLQYGEEVDRYVKQVFQEESKKKDCDETNCYRRIAALYHAEKIIALRVAEIDKGRYLVTAHLYDVPTGEMTSSQKEECEQCSFEKLKVLCKEMSRRMSKAQ
jgi:ribosomal protein L37AE/L43A